MLKIIILDAKIIIKIVNSFIYVLFLLFNLSNMLHKNKTNE